MDRGEITERLDAISEVSLGSHCGGDDQKKEPRTNQSRDGNLASCVITRLPLHRLLTQETLRIPPRWQERIVPSLLAALDHALTVIATRHPYRPLLLLHAYREEAIALALLVVERQCIEASDSTMAESLFGLRRARHGVRGDSGWGTT